MPGYDLIATNPATKRLARIQVKSRWQTDASYFLIKNLDCDFVVAVRLNRGKKGGGGKVLSPEYFILPIDVVNALVRVRETTWSHVMFRDIQDIENYRDQWSLINEFLAESDQSDYTL
jgi:hypothetical protein